VYKIRRNADFSIICGFNSARGFPLLSATNFVVCLTVFSNLTLLFNKGGKRILIFHGTCTNNTYNESRLNEENQSFPELIFGDKRNNKMQ
jgi:hypothetical protein